MKNIFKNNLITIFIALATLALAAIAIFTAYRLYQTKSTAGTPASACHGANERVIADCDYAHFSAEAIVSSGVTYNAWWEVESLGRRDGLNVSVPWEGKTSISAKSHIAFSNGIVWESNTLTANYPENCSSTPIHCEDLIFTITVSPTPTATATSAPTPTPTTPPLPGEPAIDLEKHTNGQDADNPKGPELVEGDDVKWEYIITNTGAVPLQKITLVDDHEGTVTCPQTTLAVGDRMVCTLHSTARVYQYQNEATVTAYDTDNRKVTDTDPSHYWGEGKSVSPTPAPTASPTTRPLAQAPSGTTPPIPESGTTLPTIITLTAGTLLLLGALLLAL